MFFLGIQTVSAFALTITLLALVQLLNQQSVSNRNKNSPFECGFDPHESSRLPFSLRFFLLAILFLIFDIEFAFLFPLFLKMKMLQLKSSYFGGTLFLSLLMLGLFHEWKQGTLSWVKLRGI